MALEGDQVGDHPMSEEPRGPARSAPADEVGPDHNESAPGIDDRGRDELMRLASVVAHQLKAPLASVQNVLTTVLGGFAGPLDARQRWLLEKALERSSKGLRLVRDLLRLRSVDRLQDDDLGPVNLVAVFEAAMQEIQDAARQHELKVETSVEVSDSDAGWIHAEEAMVREILGVLLDNAVKYTPREGRVTARLGLTGGGGAESAAHLWVEIVDSGIGIPSEGYRQLFEEFYRAPNAKAMAEEGTGLGLAFAWRAARRLGGSVEIEPAPTGGVRAVAGFPQRLDYAGASRTEAGGSPLAQGEEREISQRIVIVGGMTAGSKAAARIMRLDPDADVTVVERGQTLAYSGCGLPYYISGAISEQRTLVETALGAVRDSAFFHKLKNVRALDLTEVVRIDRERKTVVVRHVLDQDERDVPYDRLMLATGARPVTPEIPGAGLEGVHTLHGVEDAEAIRSLLRQPRVKDVVILGGGLLGCQITESISLRGARITLVEERSSILRILEEEMSALVRSHLESRGVRVVCGHRVARIEGEERVQAVELDDGSLLACDLVLVALGRVPNVGLAREAGLEIGSTGAVHVDSFLRTSDPCIYAAGDCTEQRHAVTGRMTWIPGAVSASVQGRVAANNICGIEEEITSVTGSVIVKLFDWTVARTGLNEREAREAGFDPLAAVIPGPDRAHFIPTARTVILKLVADRVTGRLLGAQGVGPGDVAKRIDVIATALTAGLDVDRLAQLTLAYAPPYSMAVDIVLAAANVLRNKREGRFVGISSPELLQRMLADEPPLLLDVRQPEEYERVRFRGGRHIPLGALRGRVGDLPRDKPIVIVCSYGLRSYEASRILAAHGFENVLVLDGGIEAWPYAIDRMT
jgi:NADPH-dependent 2,4-dienoyl-CoA reductase/sulfur reductase-like enzyme/rhodanese-related sulfurtransferase